MKRFISLLLSLTMALSLTGMMPVYAAEGDIDADSWVVVEENDFSADASGLISSHYWGAWAVSNTDYGYAYNASGSTDGDHWLAMKNGVPGDFVVDFDLFYDDIRNTLDSSLSFRMGLAKDMLLPSGAVSYTYSELWYDQLFSLNDNLQDDGGTEYPYSTASARKKYGLDTAPAGDPSYVNMRITVIGDTSTVYAKWNTASTWKRIKTKTAAYAGDKWLYWTLGAKMGIDNFKVYQKAARIVNETFDAGTSSWHDVITVSPYDDWVHNNSGQLQLGREYNVISTVDKYADYIIQYDYMPNYTGDCGWEFQFGDGSYFWLNNINTGNMGIPSKSEGMTINTHNYTFENRVWKTIRFRKQGTGFWLYAKNANSDESFRLVADGTVPENKMGEFKLDIRNTSSYTGLAYMDNLIIWDKGFSANTQKGLYDAYTSAVTITFNKDLAETVPQTITLTGGDTDVQCAVTKINSKAIRASIPGGTLDYGTEYTFDISTVESADGMDGTTVSFTTIDTVGMFRLMKLLMRGQIHIMQF